MSSEYSRGRVEESGKRAALSKAARLPSFPRLQIVANPAGALSNAECGP